jgi:hypothetical protein
MQQSSSAGCDPPRVRSLAGKGLCDCRQSPECTPADPGLLRRRRRYRWRRARLPFQIRLEHRKRLSIACHRMSQECQPLSCSVWRRPGTGWPICAPTADSLSRLLSAKSGMPVEGTRSQKRTGGRPKSGASFAVTIIVKIKSETFSSPIDCTRECPQTWASG